MLAALGFGVAAAVVVAGVPLFVRMPPWCDLTLYDMAAHAVMAGGTHYLDVFDTNLPGFVWCLVGVRWLFGEGYEVVRIVDLVIVGLIVILLAKLVRNAGGTWCGVAWMMAAAALFYPFTCEFSHCQRDVWMTLPIVAAVALRLRHLQSPDAGRRFRPSFLEGLIWGVAVWFKPHAGVIALAMWLFTKCRSCDVRRDLRGNLAGGACVGVAGIVWLIATGTWKPFIEVFTKWNTGYLRTIASDVPDTLERFPVMFPPWSLLHCVGIPLAIRAVRRRHGDERHFRNAVLAALYVMVLLQATFLQRNFDYVQIPVMLLLFAVLAAQRPAWLMIGAVLVFVLPQFELPGYFKQLSVPHPLTDRRRMEHWPQCFQSQLPPPLYRARMNALALGREYFPTVNMVEIGEIADFLHAQGVRDREVLAWHDTPHVAYLLLGIKPAFRFMHITTTLMNDQAFWRMTIEFRKFALPRARFVVADIMHPLRASPPEVWERRTEPGPNLLPPVLNVHARAAFPYCLPALFRSNGGHGRYVIFRITPGLEKDLDEHRVQYEFGFDLYDQPP
jgi:hypothetical protein